MTLDETIRQTIVDDEMKFFKDYRAKISAGEVSAKEINEKTQTAEKRAQSFLDTFQAELESAFSIYNLLKGVSGYYPKMTIEETEGLFDYLPIFNQLTSHAIDEMESYQFIRSVKLRSVDPAEIKTDKVAEIIALIRDDVEKNEAPDFAAALYGGESGSADIDKFIKIYSALRTTSINSRKRDSYSYATRFIKHQSAWSLYNTLQTLQKESAPKRAKEDADFAFSHDDYAELAECFLKEVPKMDRYLLTSALRELRARVIIPSNSQYARLCTEFNDAIRDCPPDQFVQSYIVINAVCGPKRR